MPVEKRPIVRYRLPVKTIVLDCDTRSLQKKSEQLLGLDQAGLRVLAQVDALGFTGSKPRAQLTGQRCQRRLRLG